MEDLMPQCTVLVVDDEALVRMVAVDVLREEGFAVYEAADAAAALELLEHAPCIDLLLTDVRMPGEMDGLQLARAARAQRPDLRVVIASGYCGSAAPLDVPFVAKPYLLQGLVDVVRAELPPGRAQAARSA